MTPTSKNALNRARNARDTKIAHFTMKTTIPPCKTYAKLGKTANHHPQGGVLSKSLVSA